MKTFFPSLLACAASLSLLATPAHAQTIPDPSFESWTTRTSSVIGGVEAPVSWLTDDDFIAEYNALQSYLPGPEPQAASANTVVRTTVARSGTSAVQLQTRGSAGGAAYLTRANLFLGSAFVANPDYGSFVNNPSGYFPFVPTGAPTTARPTAMQFYYQLLGDPTTGRADSSFVASINVKLTRQVGNRTEVVAQATGSVTSRARKYTLFNVPLRYLSTATPELVQITFSLRSNSRNVKRFSGTIWRVDDVSFTGEQASLQPASSAANLSVFPNPSTDGRYVLSASEPALLTAPLTVLDGQGLVVHREDAPRSASAQSRMLDLSELPRGLYTVRFSTPNGLVTYRISRQ